MPLTNTSQKSISQLGKAFNFVTNCGNFLLVLAFFLNSLINRRMRECAFILVSVSRKNRTGFKTGLYAPGAFCYFPSTFRMRSPGLSKKDRRYGIKSVIKGFQHNLFGIKEMMYGCRLTAIGNRQVSNTIDGTGVFFVSLHRTGINLLLCAFNLDIPYRLLIAGKTK